MAQAAEAEFIVFGGVLELAGEDGEGLGFLVAVFVVDDQEGRGFQGGEDGLEMVLVGRGLVVVAVTVLIEVGEVFGGK